MAIIPSIRLEPRIQSIVEIVVERFRPNRVILFGSHARGEALSSSDIDLFIEMESDKPSPERAVEVSTVFGLRDWPLDVVVYTPGEVRQLRGVPGSMLCNIESEGIVLYERA